MTHIGDQEDAHGEEKSFQSYTVLVFLKAKELILGAIFTIPHVLYFIFLC